MSKKQKIWFWAGLGVFILLEVLFGRFVTWFYLAYIKDLDNFHFGLINIDKNLLLEAFVMLFESLALIFSLYIYGINYSEIFFKKSTLGNIFFILIFILSIWCLYCTSYAFLFALS